MQQQSKTSISAFMEEPAGTVLLGSMNKRAYLYVSQSAERMMVERANAQRAGVQDVHEFVFVLDGQRFEVSYDELRRRLAMKISTPAVSKSDPSCMGAFERAKPR